MPTPPTASLKQEVGIMQDLVKLAYAQQRSDVQEALLLKHILTCADASSTGVLLKSALNKLESYGVDASKRLSKDKGHSLLSVIAKTILRLKSLTDTLDESTSSSWETMVAATKGTPSVRAELMKLNPGLSFMSLYGDEIFVDCISAQVTQSTVTILTLKDKLMGACAARDGQGTDSWKLELREDSALKEVAQMAKAKLRMIDADALDNQWSSFAAAACQVIKCFFVYTPDVDSRL